MRGRAIRWVRDTMLCGLLSVVAGAILNGGFLAARILQGNDVPSAMIIQKLAGWTIFGLTLPPLIALASGLQVERASMRWKGLSGTAFTVLGLAFISELAYPTGLILTPQWTALGARTTPRLVAAIGDGFTIKVVLSIGVVFTVQLLRLRKAKHEAEEEAAQLEQHLAEGRLELLRRRLDPHFLFNVLNSVVALVPKDCDAAQRMLRDLHALLHESFDSHSAQLSSLGDELRLLGHYLDIESRRFGGRLRLEWLIEPGTEGASVPTLLLQPIVENAIRHGIAPNANGGTIIVSAQSRDGRLLLEVADDGPGPAATGWRGGIGLSTTIERLRALYATEHSIVIGSRPGGGFRVAITLPCSGAAAA